MKRIFLCAYFTLASLCSFAQSTGKSSADSISTTAPQYEQWEYKTIYVDNTHRNKAQGEVEFKAHTNSETLNQYGREGWELISVTPIIAEPMGNNRTYTTRLIYTFKRKLQAKR